MNTGKMVIIDGNSLMNRAYYALPPLTTKEGMPTNAVYGFMNMLFKIFDNHHPDYISVAFDLKAPTFRHIEYDGYKAQRKGMPDELAVQMPLLKEVLDCLGIKRMEIEGYEADDIIGTVSRYCEEKGMEIFIVTGDKDAFQLVSTDAKVIYTRKGVSDFEVYDLGKIEDVYGLTPDKLIDLKGLMGDKSDNIPGVPGVGEKTALKLLKEYGSLEQVFDSIDHIKAVKLRENLRNNIQQAVLSKRLATIHRDIPLQITLEGCKAEMPDMDCVLEKFAQLEFSSLMERVKKLFDSGGTVGIMNQSYKCLEGLDDVRYAVERIVESGKMAFEIAVSTDNSINFEIYGISLAWNEAEGGYIPMGHTDNSLHANTVFSMLKPVFESSEIEKYGHHLKQDIIALKQKNIRLVNYVFDAEIFAYLLDPSASSYDLEKIIMKYLGRNIQGREELLGKGKNAAAFNQLEMTDICAFLASRATGLFLLKPVMEKVIEEKGMVQLAYEVELPLVEVLADMELTGFKVDRHELLQLSEKLQGNIEKLTHDIFNMVGKEFNINSTKQLGEVLFNKLALPPVKKTKTGYSTDVQVLEQLKDKHPIVGKVIEYRQLGKLKSTYVDGLLKTIDPNTGKIHSSFKQTVTATGRISSIEPNLQNIPVKLQMGREVRRVFVPENSEYVLVDADYSQIELRVLAHISEDINLIEAFRLDQDIHLQTAAKVFNKNPQDVTPYMRNSAKAVNFGIIYGISDFGLSRNLHISRKQAGEYIENYFKKYSGVKRYMDNIVEKGKKYGLVTTILGRIRYLPEIKSRNKNIRGFGERMAMNTPIQGSAADIIKLAMIKVHRRLKEENARARLLLQVHDELIVETHKDEIGRVKELVRECMEDAIRLKVPLKVDISTGNSWYEAK